MATTTMKIHILINGDKWSKAQPFVFSPHSITFNMLLDRLTSRVRPTFGAVHRIYTLEGKRVRELERLSSGETYVVAANTTFKRVAYPGAAPRATSPPRKTRTPPSSAGKVILVAKNGEAQAPLRVPLPSAVSSMDQLFRLLNGRVTLSTGPVRKLYTVEGKPVASPSTLVDRDLYVASGTERFKPLSYELWKTTQTSGGGSSGPSPIKRHKTPGSIKTTKFQALEAEFASLVTNKRQLLSLWRALDYNGNNIVSLAEVDKLVVERYPLLDSKPALMRAFKQTTLKDGDGDAWVERAEFPALLRNIFIFNKLFTVFDKLDSDQDDRLDLDEFRKGAVHAGLKLSPEQLTQEFQRIDVNNGGLVLFDEFCAWVAANAMPIDGDTLTSTTMASTKMAVAPSSSSSQPLSTLRDADPAVKTDKFDKTEAAVKAVLADKVQLKHAWQSCDYNGNGLCSLAELDKYIVSNYAILDHKPALMRAYKQTTLNDGDGDAWVERAEFPAFLRNVFYFNKLFHAFEQIDSDDDRRLDFDEFKAGLKVLDMALSDREARQEFDTMDSNDGGVVLFDEFCAYVATKQCPVDDDVLSEFTMASPIMATRQANPAAAKGSDKDATALLLATFAGIEEKFHQIATDKTRLQRAWDSLDYNGNGKVSLAEVDKWVVTRYPVLNHKPALMRAFKKTTLQDGDGDAWVEKEEFGGLLHNLVHFVKVFAVFADVDKNHDRRLTRDEVKTMLQRLGMESQLDAVFEAADTNDGGLILFDEFCASLAKLAVPT
eukprot:m.109156 g.109156  ORF g.109156 m.109156 type:complete len:772 (-) comp15337_c0_seq4:117-2432(-)